MQSRWITPLHGVTSLSQAPHFHLSLQLVFQPCRQQAFSLSFTSPSSSSSESLLAIAFGARRPSSTEQSQGQSGDSNTGLCALSIVLSKAWTQELKICGFFCHKESAATWGTSGQRMFPFRGLEHTRCDHQLIPRTACQCRGQSCVTQVTRLWDFTGKLHRRYGVEESGRKIF